MKTATSFDRTIEVFKSKNYENRKFIEDAEDISNAIFQIVKARNDLGMTQREVAEKAGIKQPALARIELLKVMPKLDTLVKIASAVGLKVKLDSLEKQKATTYYYFVNSQSYSTIIKEAINYGSKDSH